MKSVRTEILFLSIGGHSVGRYLNNAKGE
jgi:hypothetical protein